MARQEKLVVQHRLKPVPPFADKFWMTGGTDIVMLQLLVSRGRTAWAWAKTAAAETTYRIEFGLLVGRQDCVEGGVRFAVDGQDLALQCADRRRELVDSGCGVALDGGLQ